MTGISRALERPEEADDILRDLKAAEKMDRKFAQVDAAEHTKLKVRVELEVERRLRIQSALDNAEKRCYASNRLLEKKCGELEERESAWAAARENLESRLNKSEGDNERLEKMIREKEAKIVESERMAKDLMLKAEEFEDMFIGQLETVKSLQNDLSVASDENRALVKEMEMLNAMFNELERTHVTEALEDCEDMDAVARDSTDHISPILRDDGGEIKVKDLLDAVQGDGDSAKESSGSIADSCFKEVTTKNGTRMVLSVSKTFMKLKDLILEKKTLEDQVEKMKFVNEVLSSKVNTHEAKLWNITDELNKTWTYVSTLKMQHQKLHTNEQILRAELNEKRQILAKLREELEFTRENWSLVKQKTADSEREWRSLREEFAERRALAEQRIQRLAKPVAAAAPSAVETANSGSESGFSDSLTTEDEDSPDTPPPVKKSIPAPELPNQTTSTEAEENKEEEGGEKSGPPQQKAPESVEEQPRLPLPEAVTPTFMPVFIPPLDYLTSIPDELLPSLLQPRDPRKVVTELGDDSGGGSGGTDYGAIYNRLLESTQRTLELASRLAEVNRSLGRQDGIAAGEESEDGDEEDVLDAATTTSEDVDPETEATEEEGDDGNSVVSASDIVSDIVPLTSDMLADIEDDEVDDDIQEENDIEGSEGWQRTLGDGSITDARAEEGEGLDDDEEDVSLEAPFPPDFEIRFDRHRRLSASDSETETEDNLLGASDGTPFDPTFWERRFEDEEEESVTRVIGDNAEESDFRPNDAPPPPTGPPPPPPPPQSLGAIPRLSRFQNVGSGTSSSDTDSEDDEDGDEDATTVTRILIKHLPKQMRRLRSDKAELEDRIRDLEARLSEQAVCIREMERRQRVERERADDAEGRLRETDEAVATAASYPIVVPRDGVRARWIFTSAPKGSLATVTADKGQPAIVPEVEIDFGGGSDFTVEAAVGKDDANEITMSVQVPQGQRISDVKFCLVLERLEP